MCAAIAAITIAGPRPGCRVVLCPRAPLFPATGIAGRAAPSFYRGGDGPLSTQMTRTTIRWSRPTPQRAARPAIRRTPDYNGAQQEGFGIWQMTIRNGRRCSAAVAYLRPALARPNLTVAVNALATRIIIENKRAVGIEYAVRGQTQAARADREVILSGGVINSPQLLMLSGIGDPERSARATASP